MTTCRSLRPVLAGVLAVAAATAVVPAQPQYEGARTIPVTDIMPAAFVHGPHFKLEPTVSTPGYFDEFTIVSDYGRLEAEGQTMLAIRLRDVDALALLAGVTTTDVFVQAAGDTMVTIGKSAYSAVSSPVETAKGVGEGIKRFGVNLGRKAKRVTGNVYEGATAEPKEGGPSTSAKAAAAGESAANAVFGVNTSMRKWAYKVGADPYTLNPVLRDALESVARVDAAGTIATKIVVPVPTVVTTAGTVGDLVWKQDPEEVIKLNEKRAAAFGADKKAATALYNTKPFTLTYQTAFIEALHDVKPKGAADYLLTATESETEREALFFTESAVMLKQFHATNPVTAMLTDSRAMVARVSDGRAVVLLPVDWVRWTAAFEKAAREVETRARTELGATRMELQITGRISPVAKEALAAMGWTVKDQVPVKTAWTTRN